jgi:hypothetical protein
MKYLQFRMLLNQEKFYLDQFLRIVVQQLGVVGTPTRRLLVFRNGREHVV